MICDLHVQAPLDGAALGHQGELVERQRPGDPRRDDERQAVILSLGSIEDLVGTERLGRRTGNVVAPSSAGLKRPRRRRAG